MQQIAEQDADRIFADWGTSAILEEITSYFDPETGQLEESELLTDVTVIASPLGATPASATTALGHTATRTFLLRSGNLPAKIDWASSRIHCDGVHYAVTVVHTSTIPGTVAVECLVLREFHDETSD